MALDVVLIEEGFDVLVEQPAAGERIVDLVYGRLFAMNPALKRRFTLGRSDKEFYVAMDVQRRKLINVLMLVRKSASDLQSIRPALVSLGALHTERFHIPAHEFLAVGYVLIDAMGDVGGAGWIERYGAAWTAYYQVLTEIMLQGSRADDRIREESERQLRDLSASLRHRRLVERTWHFLEHHRGCRARRHFLSWFVFGNGRCTCGLEELQDDLAA